MKKNYAQATEGTAFVGDGVSLTWAFGGQREVIEYDITDPEASQRFKMRVANGVIVEVDAPLTDQHEDAPTAYRLYEGDEARQVLEEPAGPVITRRHNRATGETIEVVLPSTGDIVRRNPVTIDPVEQEVALPKAETIRAIHRPNAEPKAPSRRKVTA